MAAGFSQSEKPKGTHHLNLFGGSLGELTADLDFESAAGVGHSL